MNLINARTRATVKPFIE